MDTKKLKYLEGLLLKMKKEFEEELAELEEKFNLSQQDSSHDISAYPTHPADLGSDTESREESSYLITSIVKKLGRVNHAIEKICSGTYGTCENCESKIPFEHLKTIPYV